MKLAGDIPPFVGNDLTYEFEHLKSAYARLIEQALLEQKGIVVVEIAEAEYTRAVGATVRA